MSEFNQLKGKFVWIVLALFEMPDRRASGSELLLKGRTAMQKTKGLNQLAGRIASSTILCGFLIAGEAVSQPDFTPPATFATATHTPFYPEEYYAADLDVADFTGATGNAIDGFLDVGVFSGPIGTNAGDTYPEEEFSSVITLFRNTQNWGTGGSAPTSSLAAYLTQPIVTVCDDCFAGEMQFAHMNDDEFIDIVATSTTISGSGQIHVLLYNSTLQQFVANPPFTGGGTSLPPLQAFAIGDFDGDGYNDIVATVHRDVIPGTSTDLDFVYRLKNINAGSGFGTLLRVTPDITVTNSMADDYPAGEIVAGEFNTLQGFPGSVRPEFITAEPFVSSLTVGTGAGSFAFSQSDQPQSFPCGSPAGVGSLAYNSMAVGHVNAGSSLDLVATGSAGISPEAYVLLGNNRGRLLPVCINGSIAPPIDFQIPAMCAMGGVAVPENIGDHFLTVGYIDDDTYLDIVLASAGDPNGQRYAGIALGNGDGTFTVGPNCGHWLVYANSPLAENPRDRVLVANMDNSGHDEILVLASWENGLVVYKNND